MLKASTIISIKNPYYIKEVELMALVELWYKQDFIMEKEEKILKFLRAFELKYIKIRLSNFIKAEKVSILIIFYHIYFVE